MRPISPNNDSSGFDKNKAFLATQNQSHAPTGLNAWELLKTKLSEVIDLQLFSVWISPLQAQVISPFEILVTLPNYVFYRGLLDRFSDTIEHCKTMLGIDHLMIRFEVAGSSILLEQEGIGSEEELRNTFDIPSKTHYSDTMFSRDSFSDNFSPTLKAPSHETPPSVSSIQDDDTSANGSGEPLLKIKSTLNPNYKFETFVRGTSNQFAYATCSSVAEAPGQAYNPLFIYGSTGLGKTHLLHAVGLKVLEKNPSATITYITSETFMNEMVHCLRWNKMWEFRRKYRHTDVLLVDDIQFISKKTKTQEEFFHTFNALHEAKKQIVITSDLFPQDIPDIEDRLRNRFQWGLIADIQAPDLETRVAILQKKASFLNIKLSEDVAFYIASQAKRNVRELEGALHRIAAFSGMQGRPIDIELASETFQNVLGEPPKRLTVEAIQRLVAEHFKVKIADLKSKRRQQAIALPRQIAMYLARVRTKSSFPEIGIKFGGKDHTTVMHAVRKIEEDREKDLDLKTLLEALERKIEQLN